MCLAPQHVNDQQNRDMSLVLTMNQKTTADPGWHRPGSRRRRQHELATLAAASKSPQHSQPQANTTCHVPKIEFERTQELACAGLRPRKTVLGTLIVALAVTVAEATRRRQQDYSTAAPRRKAADDDSKSQHRARCVLGHRARTTPALRGTDSQQGRLARNRLSEKTSELGVARSKFAQAAIIESSHDTVHLTRIETRP